MRILGLLGGTSWHSTIDYYRFINQYVNDHFGDNTNPPLLVYTMNQSLIHAHQSTSNWEEIANILIEAGIRLQKAGAERLMFCANTPHKVYDMVQEKINVPIIHIADATADDIKIKGIKSVCFLGTKYSMAEDFITKRIVARDIRVLTPVVDETMEELHRIIIEELTYGKILPESKTYVQNCIKSFVDLGAEGVILGCTEFPLMIKKQDLDIPIFNTTEIHAKAGAEFVLSDF